MSMDLEVATEQAAAHLRRCRLCPRNCGVNRAAGELGYCRLDAKTRCFREMLHPGEEAELSPSHQVYLAGCNLRCEFCTVAEWNQEPQAVGIVDPDWLLGRIGARRRQGARNVNLLGGEPAVSVGGILRLLGRLRGGTPIVFNSNMYYNPCVDAWLRGHIDVFLADLKCGNPGCAKAMLDAGDYVEVARRNIRMTRAHADVIVRHLILPGHADCCLRPTLHWLATEAPGVKVSLRTNYVPPARANAAPAGYVSEQEISAARNEARGLGLRLIV
jgi:putative pyruvate formate lyase activating enzyme